MVGGVKKGPALPEQGESRDSRNKKKRRASPSTGEEREHSTQTVRGVTEPPTTTATKVVRGHSLRDSARDV